MIEVTRISTVKITQIIKLEDESQLVNKNEYSKRLKTRIDKDCFDHVEVTEIKDFMIEK